MSGRTLAQDHNDLASHIVIDQPLRLSAWGRTHQLIGIIIQRRCRRRIGGYGGRCPAHHIGRGGAEGSGAEERGKTPGQKPMGRVSKQHFLILHAAPFGAQAAGEIAADRRRQHGDDN